MTLILRVDPIGPNGAKASGYIDVWPADDTLTGTGFFYQQISSLHFTVDDVLAYQDLTLDASDVSGLTTTPLRYYVRERLDHTERAPAPYVIQVLTANGSPQRLSDLRAQALAAPDIALTPGYLTEITSTDNSVTITPSGTQRDLSVPPVDLSGYALESDLVAEAGTRAADDTTLAGLITAEAGTRAAADTANATAITTEATTRATADGLRLLKASNLSDVADVATARSNLGAAAAADLTTETTNRTNGDLRPIEAGFTVDGSVYLTFPYAATLAAPSATPGTATLTYAKSLAASPTSFSAISSWPATFAAGDTLRVTAATVTTFETTRMQRTA